MFASRAEQRYPSRKCEWFDGCMEFSTQHNISRSSNGSQESSESARSSSIWSSSSGSSSGGMAFVEAKEWEYFYKEK